MQVTDPRRIALSDLRGRRERAEAARRALLGGTMNAVRQALAAGVSVTEAARLLGVTRETTYQLRDGERSV